MQSIDLVLDDVRAYRHMNLMIEFARRGISSPRASETGPNFVNGKREGTYHIFLLAEEVADEYVARMQPEPTEIEAAAERKFMGYQPSFASPSFVQPLADSSHYRPQTNLT